MSVALARTHNTKGVATLGAVARTRSAEMSGLGSAPDPDTLNALAAAGYDAGTLQTLLAMGVSDEQLLALPYPADPGEMANAVAMLMNQLGGALPPPGGNATQAGSYPTGAVPTNVSTAWGAYDLTQEATWAQFNSIFTSIKNELQAVAARFPGDADTAQHIQDFNSTVLQYAGYYTQLFGSAPSPIPLASTTGLGSMTMGAERRRSVAGLGVFPILAVAGIVAAIVAILATAYAIHQWAQVKLAQAPAQTAVANAQSTQAANQSALVTQYRALMASGNTTAANALLPTLAALGINPNASGSTDWTTWFQNNMVLIFAGFAAIVVLPPLIKKL